MIGGRRFGKLYKHNEYKRDRLLNGEKIISREAGNSMLPKLKSRQPVELTPIKWEDCQNGDIVFCRVKGYYYTHLVKGKSNKGLLIGNNKGGINGWTKAVFGKVTKIFNEGDI